MADVTEYARLTTQALKIESRRAAHRLGFLVVLIIVIGFTVAGAWIASSAALGYWFYVSGTSLPVAVLTVGVANLVFGLLLTMAAFRIAADVGFPVTKSLLIRLKEVIPHE